MFSREHTRVRDIWRRQRTHAPSGVSLQSEAQSETKEFVNRKIMYRWEGAAWCVGQIVRHITDARRMIQTQRDQTLKRRDLNASHTLGCAGKTDRKPNPSGHDAEGGSTPGQTRKKPSDLSAYREERGRGEGGGVYAVCMR